MLVPLPEPDTPLSRLVAAGRARPAEGQLLDLGKPTGEASLRGTDELARQRRERS